MQHFMTLWVQALYFCLQFSASLTKLELRINFLKAFIVTAFVNFSVISCFLLLKEELLFKSLAEILLKRINLSLFLCIFILVGIPHLLTYVQLNRKIGDSCVLRVPEFRIQGLDFYQIVNTKNVDQTINGHNQDDKQPHFLFFNYFFIAIAAVSLDVDNTVIVLAFS